LTVASALSALAACQPAGSPPSAPLAPTSTAAPAGACEEPTQGVVTVVRFSAEGECLPSDAIVQYRCSPDDPPVLHVASDRGAVAFLGGPFAVPVETLPATVRSVGRGDGTEVLIADPAVASSSSPPATATPPPPGDEPIQLDPLVYVRHDGVTERWLRLPRRRAVAQPPSAWLIGDSILDGGRDHVTAALSDWSITIDAEVGRSSSTGVALAQDAVAQGADVVLVELGTNDAAPDAFRSNLIQTLDALREVPLVLWQTARAPEERTAIADIDRAIRKTVPIYPNAAIADWAAFVTPEQLMTDGIHPLEGSEDLEAHLIRPLLIAWRDALTGEGATSCGRRVVRTGA
jgi:hypothetical protein